MELSSGRFDRLPLRALVAFEAAARHGKFAAAASELAMSQAAISQHVAQLEAELGTRLFERRHRGVVPTPEGEKLAVMVGQGLRQIAEGMALTRRREPTRAVQILTDFGFAAWWLMPRIATLTEQMPDVEIRLLTISGAGAEYGPGNAGLGECDIAVLFGNGPWPGTTTRLLFPERIHPVAAPSLIGDRALPLPAEDIATMRLLHLRSTSPERWFDWDDWFKGMGAPPVTRRRELEFNNYQLLLQAALQGAGVALGWAPLVDPLIESGQLVRLRDEALGHARGYHLIEPLAARPSNDAAAVAAWLWEQRAPDA